MVARTLFILCAFCLSGFIDPADWEGQKYAAAKTAESAAYQAETEKEVFFYVNLARLFPKEFAEKYIKADHKLTPYHTSLYKTLHSMKPVPAIQPDKELYELALCWAKEGGKTGAIGHNRKKCKEGYSAECCSYAEETALGIVLQLLIDKGIPSLGHRKALLNGGYSKMGVSIQPHKKYASHAVLDMW